MRAADQWAAIAAGLDPAWDEVTLTFTAENARGAEDAAAVLGPLQPGRVGGDLRLQVARRGGGPERLANVLRRLDRRRIWGTLELVGSHVAPAEEREAAPESLVRAWDAEQAKLPPDWSDLLCELDVDSSDFLARAALLGAPLNPTRNPDAHALRFRVGRGGYGASPIMARRCFERMDEDGITGRLSVLNALSNTDYVGTQGPVWRIAGRSV